MIEPLGQGNGDVASRIVLLPTKHEPDLNNPYIRALEGGAWSEPIPITTHLPDGRQASFTIGTPIERPFKPNLTTLSRTISPHIFKIGQMVIYDPAEEKIEYGKPFDVKEKGTVRDVLVMEAEAEVNPVDMQWRFGDGQRVVDVVEAYRKFAREHELPRIEVVIACNKEENPKIIASGMKVRDIPDIYEIVQVWGDEMVLLDKYKTPIGVSGIPNVEMHPMNGFFMGIDEFLKRKVQDDQGEITA